MDETGRPRLVIFTDLDGTLLDLKTYSYLPALEALRRIITSGVRLVFCSSKTRVEQEHLQEQIGIRDVMIVENGSAILIPPRCTPPSGQSSAPTEVIELGASATGIRAELDAVRLETRLRFRGFKEIPFQELCRLTDLDAEAALRAQTRQYSETIVSEMSAAEMKSFCEALQSRGLSCIPGSRFHTVVSLNVDKGRAVRLVTEMLRNEMGDVCTAGIGDSRNDEPMLAAVDRPFLFLRSDGPREDLQLACLTTVNGSGPVAWNRLVCSLLDEAPVQ